MKIVCKDDNPAITSCLRQDAQRLNGSCLETYGGGQARSQVSARGGAPSRSALRRKFGWVKIGPYLPMVALP